MHTRQRIGIGIEIAIKHCNLHSKFGIEHGGFGVSISIFYRDRNIEIKRLRFPDICPPCLDNALSLLNTHMKPVGFRRSTRHPGMPGVPRQYSFCFLRVPFSFFLLFGCTVVRYKILKYHRETYISSWYCWGLQGTWNGIPQVVTRSAVPSRTGAAIGVHAYYYFAPDVCFLPLGHCFIVPVFRIHIYSYVYNT